MHLRMLIVLALCTLMAQPVIAGAEVLQIVVVDGDTLMVQMAESLPVGLQTLVVDGDTLMVQVLAEPLPEDDPPLAASDKRLIGLVQAASVDSSVSVQAESETVRSDSLSQKMEGVGPHRGTRRGPPTWEEEKEKFFRQLRERGKPTLEKPSRPVKERVRRFVTSAIVGTLAGAGVGFIGIRADDSESGHWGGAVLFYASTAAGLVIGTIIGLGLASEPPEPYAPPSKPNESSQVSIGPGPDTMGQLSAVVTVRF